MYSSIFYCKVTLKLPFYITLHHSSDILFKKLWTLANLYNFSNK